MKAPSKKPYVRPRLNVYGPVGELTRQSDQDNADVPAGTPNTAYPPAPGS